MSPTLLKVHFALDKLQKYSNKSGASVRLRTDLLKPFAWLPDSCQNVCSQSDKQKLTTGVLKRKPEVGLKWLTHHLQVTDTYGDAFVAIQCCPPHRNWWRKLQSIIFESLQCKRVACAVCSKCQGSRRLSSEMLFTVQVQDAEVLRPAACHWDCFCKEVFNTAFSMCEFLWDQTLTHRCWTPYSE